MIPFPNKKYQIIYADPPWRYKDKLGSKAVKMGGCENHYNSMALEDICSLPVYDIADQNCVLFLWVTMPQLNKVWSVIDSWGFIYKTVAFCWVKLNPKNGGIFKGMGHWVRGNAELVLLCTKGRPHRIAKNVSQIILSPRREHSRKPDEVRDRIVLLMGDLPRIELFARQRYEGWDAWGDELE